MLGDTLSVALWKSAIAVLGVIGLGLLIAFVPTPFSARAAEREANRKRRSGDKDAPSKLSGKSNEEWAAALRAAEQRAEKAERLQAQAETLLARRETWCARAGEPCRVAEIAEKKNDHE